MIANIRDFIGRTYPPFAGFIFLALGMVTLIWPEILAHYSIGIESSDARVAVRAMIGGGEIGIGLLLLTSERAGLSLRQRGLIAATIFASVGASRFLAIWIEGLEFLTIQPLREGAIELSLAGLGFWASPSR